MRNNLAGAISRIEPDGERAWMVFTQTGGATLMVRVTDDARNALGLVVGQRVWVLIKAVSLRGHVFVRPASAPQP